MRSACHAARSSIEDAPTHSLMMLRGMAYPRSLVGAEPGVLAEHGLAQEAEVARVHGRVFARLLVLIIDRREVQEALVDDLEIVVGVDGTHHAELSGLGAGRGLQRSRLLLEIDVLDLERQRVRRLGLEHAGFVAPGRSARERATEVLGRVLGGNRRPQRAESEKDGDGAGSAKPPTTADNQARLHARLIAKG